MSLTKHLLERITQVSVSAKALANYGSQLKMFELYDNPLPNWRIDLVDTSFSASTIEVLCENTPI